MDKETIKEFLKPTWKKLLLYVFLFFTLAIILDVNSIHNLFFGTSFWSTYWNPFTHLSPYYPITSECMIPEGCGPNYMGPATTWVFKTDIFVGLIIKSILVYIISCFAINKFKTKK